jgi:arabinofuranan 3-O-arabinosyltransferase
LSPRRTSQLFHALLALLAYVPLLRSEPGMVAADTKSYLYLDPARLLSRAISMWDPNVGMGTLTHQTIGYLFPMGPWYWLLERLGFPDWVAQRLWLGTVLFAAGAGVLFLARTVSLSDRATATARLGVLVAALAYMLSPYVLDYSARI